MPVSHSKESGFGNRTHLSVPPEVIGVTSVSQLSEPHSSYMGSIVITVAPTRTGSGPREMVPVKPSSQSGADTMPNRGVRTFGLFSKCLRPLPRGAPARAGPTELTGVHRVLATSQGSAGGKPGAAAQRRDSQET